MRISPMHQRARMLVGGVTFFNAVDGLALASVLPVLTETWHLSLEQVGFLISAGYLGQLAGNILAGWAAERIGRLSTIAFAAATFSLSSLLCMVSWGYGSLLLFRTLQGLGLGGELPVAAVYINELSAAKNRGRFTLFYEWAYPLGRVGVALAGVAVVSHWGWRYLFLLGGSPVFLALALKPLLPESPRWLASKGRMPEATAAIERMEGRMNVDVNPQPRAHTPNLTGLPGTDWTELFRGIYLSRTLVAWVLWFSAFLIVNGLSNWVPTLYRTVFHVPLQTALKYGLLTNLASLAGCIAVACLIDRTGRRAWFAGALFLGSAAFLALWRIGVSSSITVLILTSIGSFFVNSVTVGLYLHTAETYPTRLRALGVSVASGWLRISSMLGATMIGITVQHYGLRGVFMEFGVVSMIAALVAGFFCVETKGRVLEDVSP
jgi:MFS transporter, putative metabolite:H+ symporter